MGNTEEKVQSAIYDKVHKTGWEMQLLFSLFLGFIYSLGIFAGRIQTAVWIDIACILPVYGIILTLVFLVSMLFVNYDMLYQEEKLMHNIQETEKQTAYKQLLKNKIPDIMKVTALAGGCGILISAAVFILLKIPVETRGLFLCLMLALLVSTVVFLAAFIFAVLLHKACCGQGHFTGDSKMYQRCRQGVIFGGISILVILAVYFLVFLISGKQEISARTEYFFPNDMYWTLNEDETKEEAEEKIEKLAKKEQVLLSQMISYRFFIYDMKAELENERIKLSGYKNDETDKETVIGITCITAEDYRKARKEINNNSNFPH